MMTDLPDDQPASDDVEQPDRRPLITPEAFLMVQNLISLCVNPKEVRKQLRSLHDALAAVDAAEKRLNDARVAHDAHISKTAAELADREKKLRAREAQHAAERGRWESTQQMIREGSAARKYRHPDDDFTPPAGSGMGRTFTERRNVRHDDLGQPYAAHTTLTRTVTEPE
jgi:hypothetical protein